MGACYDDLKDFIDYTIPNDDNSDPESGVCWVLVEDAPESAKIAFEKYLESMRDLKKRGWKV